MESLYTIYRPHHIHQRDDVTIYYIYIPVSLIRVCVVKKLCHSRGLGQLMGVAVMEYYERALQFLNVIHIYTSGMFFKNH